MKIVMQHVQPCFYPKIYSCANLEKATINARQFTDPSQKSVIRNIHIDNVKVIGIL